MLYFDMCMVKMLAMVSARTMNVYRETGEFVILVSHKDFVLSSERSDQRHL
jgi:hypothetical protein